MITKGLPFMQNNQLFRCNGWQVTLCVVSLVATGCSWNAVSRSSAQLSPVGQQAPASASSLASEGGSSASHVVASNAGQGGAVTQTSSEPPVPPNTASTHVESDAPADAALVARLSEYFRHFGKDRSFGFFTKEWAPTVESYLRLKNVSVGALVRSARQFYADKDAIAIEPEVASTRVQNVAGRKRVSLKLTMSWTTKPDSAAKDCGTLDANMEWQAGSVVAHRMQAMATLTLDESGRFVAYDEVPDKPILLRVKYHGDPLPAFIALPIGPARTDPGVTAAFTIADGTLVEDLGDEFTCGLNASEVDAVRRVRYRGQKVWLLKQWTYFTGHNFVGEDTLVPSP